MSDRSLEEFFEEAEPPEVLDQDQEALSRRKFLTGAMAGGAAGLVVAAGTGVAVWQVVDADKEKAETELERLQGLVDLYEGLEKVGLDAILQTGMVAMALPLEAVELGARALKSGLDWAEKALLSLGESLPTARESLLWLESRVSAMADGIHTLETAVGQALDRATDNILGDALKEFSQMVLDYLPFGLGEKIRDVLDGLVSLATGVDDLVAGVNTHLLEPLRQKWFSDEPDEGLGASLVKPLVERVLDPLEAHLASLATLTDNWQNQLAAPAEKALAERALLRDEIARYKKEQGLG